MPPRLAATGPGNWSQVADAYAESFAPLCAGTHAHLLTATGITGSRMVGRRVLDVGTGTGELAGLAARHGAVVVAADPDEAMLERARQHAADACLVLGGVPLLPFAAASFDVVLANFVINHVPDPRAGVRELARVTDPEGLVGITIWPSETSVQNRLWAEVIAASGAVPPPSARLPEEKDFSRTVDGLSGLVAEAGMVPVRGGTVRWEHRTDPEVFWRGAAAGVAGIGRVVTSQPEAVRRRMKAEYDALVVPLLDHGELVLATEAVMVVGAVHTDEFR